MKFHREQLTSEEFDGKTLHLLTRHCSFSFIEFWKTVEGDYCQVVIIDQCNDHYSVDIKYDYLSAVRKRRAIAFINNHC